MFLIGDEQIKHIKILHTYLIVNVITMLIKTRGRSHYQNPKEQGHYRKQEDSNDKTTRMIPNSNVAKTYIFTVINSGKLKIESLCCV